MINQELISILNEQIKNRFIANSAIEGINEKVKHLTKKLVLSKYKKEILIKNGLEFGLEDVLVNFWNCRADSISIDKIEVKLIYFCISKLPKTKIQQLEKAKEYFLKYKSMPWNNFKIPIWIENRYELDINKVLEENINLKIQ